MYPYLSPPMPMIEVLVMKFTLSRCPSFHPFARPMVHSRLSYYFIVIAL